MWQATKPRSFLLAMGKRLYRAADRRRVRMNRILYGMHAVLRPEERNADSGLSFANLHLSGAGALSVMVGASAKRKPNTDAASTLTGARSLAASSSPLSLG